MTDFIEFWEWLQTGELNYVFLAAILCSVILPIFFVLPRYAAPRYSVSKGRREVEITYVSEAPTAENRFNRNWARGETSDGQEVWLDFRKMGIRQFDRVSALVLCTENPPVDCIGRAPLPLPAR